MSLAGTHPDVQRGRLRSRFAGVGVRARLLIAVGLVAFTTVAVGAFGIQRMAALSRTADQVTVSAKHLDALRTLQADWWQLSTWVTRVDLVGLPDSTMTDFRANLAASNATLAAQTALVATLDLSRTAEASFAEFTTAVKQVATAMADEERLVAANAPLEQRLPPTKIIQAAETQIGRSLVAATSAATSDAAAAAAVAHRTYTSARMWTLLAMLVGTVAGVLLALLVANGVTRPVRRILEVLDRVAQGDLRGRVGVTGVRELQAAASSLDRGLDAITSVLGLVGESAASLATSSTALRVVADDITANTRTAAEQAAVAVSTAGEVASSVNTVATGSGEMEAAINEIAHNATQAALVAGQAVGEAESTTRSISKLGDSSREIADVVKLITGIAAQTNLLALNATIESARAGEAGKGFAVVASEVKELAQETARATDGISSRVDAIQADSAGAVSAISSISSVIGQIHSYQETIAAAVEEQTATTTEMNRNVAIAAAGARDISDAVSGLAAGAANTADRAVSAQQAAGDLASMSHHIQEALHQFSL